MALKPYSDKLNSRTYSIGISKKVPVNSANLSYVSAPDITDNNISIVNEAVGLAQRTKDNYEIYHANDAYLLENENGVSVIPNENVIVTDEFTIKELPSDIPEPLFYVASLKNRIKAISANKDIVRNSIPYVYGYETQTLSQLKDSNTSTDKADITPLVHILDITVDDGISETVVSSGYKLRLIKDIQTAVDAYEIRIYNNFDSDKTYKVTFRSYDGSLVTEVINSTELFLEVDKSEIGGSGFMDSKYAIEQVEDGYKVYAPTQLYKVTDVNRTPFEFKYRILGNMQSEFDRSSPINIKVGIVYLNANVSTDVKGVITSFVNEIGITFPNNFSFINPHPPKEFWKDPTLLDNPMEYLGSQEYWEVNLTAPQYYINDYDLIIITGYGTHDLSAYNSILATYLNQGGKILIDNLSNSNTELLQISFGTTDPILSYSYEIIETVPTILSASKQFVGSTSYKIGPLYDLSAINSNKISYFITTDTQVSPKTTLLSADAQRWTDIIRYTDSNISIGYKTYNSRGKVYFSNCGILKAFCQKPTTETKQFLTNMLIAISGDKWICTPWIYDRIYHINQLYDQEYNISGYITDISENNTTIAKKIIADKSREILSGYSNAFDSTYEGTYFIESLEYRNKPGTSIKAWQPLLNMYMPSVLGEDEPLYVYAINASNSNFSVDDLQGYSNSDIAIYNEKITFKFTVRPYTYVWRNVDNVLVQERLYGTGSNISVVEVTISKSDGQVNLGLLSSMIPQIPGGSQWADPYNIFFEVKVGYYENGAFNGNEQRVNLRIYDKATGQYMYTNEGDNIISYNDLYSYRNVLRSSGYYTMRKKSEDIIVQAATNYYILMANKRTFAVLEQQDATFDLLMPINMNTNENWHPRIKNVNFIKNSFSKDDYDRIAKTLGFRFEKSYIQSRIAEYYGASPEDDKVAAILAKLDGNGTTLSEEDSQIIAEAFTMIDGDVTYEYNMAEYHRQPWNPGEPYKFSKNETAKYINANTIQIQYPHVYVSEGAVTREALERVSADMYKSVHMNWMQSKPTTLEVEDINEIGGWRTLAPETYSIDFANGIITTSVEETGTVYATYTYSTIDISRKKYNNSAISLEPLTQLDVNYYDIAHNGILETPVPKVYFNDRWQGMVLASPTEYEIDYERGFLKLKHKTVSDVLMSYSYTQSEKLSLRDYDPNTGTIQIAESIGFNDDIRVSYYYEDEYYDYKGYLDGKTFIYLDMNPTRGHICTIPVIVDGSIIYKNVATHELLNKTVYFYMLPYKVLKGNTVVEENSITIRHTFDREELELLQLAHPEIMVIGNIKITNEYTPYDVINLDTRVRGGGLKESITKEKIEKTDELSLNFWDISDFDGQTYYANGIVIIKLPKSVLDRFSTTEVQQIIEKQIALGVMPIIKYY